MISKLKYAFSHGSLSEAVHHAVLMKVSSVALLVLMPLFIFIVGPMIGRPHAEVVAFLGQPFPAIVVALTFVVGFKHFSDGVQVLLEDYVHGTARKISIMIMTGLSYAAMLIGLYAIVKIAF
ncbi:MAG: succinate dehydrogenase, hydrophobic membrane anchor protein [Pseudomonadota bacterium]